MKCLECGKELKIINSLHLKSHNMTCDEYEKKFNVKIKPWNKGLTKETDERVKKQSINQTGRIFSEKHIENLSKSHIGILKGKTYEEIHGIEKAKELRENRSKTHKDKVVKEDTKIKLRKLYEGKTYKEIHGEEKAKEIKFKIRKNVIKRIKKNGGIFPGYNSNAIPILAEFDKLNNTKGIYATHPQEYEIKELGYFLDYVNFDLKLIIEIDEKHHFDKLGRLRERDVRRQKEIQRYYSDFKFLRFKDGEMNKILKAGSNNER